MLPTILIAMLLAVSTGVSGEAEDSQRRDFSIVQNTDGQCLSPEEKQQTIDSILQNIDVNILYGSVSGERSIPTVDLVDGQAGVHPTPAEVCPNGTYYSVSANNGTTSCQPCPTNTETSGVGVAMCPCITGYYRTDEEGPSTPCTPPPSACQNITVDSWTTYNQITVTWNRPEVTGRDDFYYNIYHDNANSSCTDEPGQLIKHNVSPYVDNGNKVSYAVSGLSPLTSYTIRVTVHNGVSDQDPEGEENRMCEIRADTRPLCKSTELLTNTSSPGEPFQDPCAAAIRRILIGHADIVDSIQVTYILNDGSEYTAPRHGGSGGRTTVIDLESGEQIVAVTGGPTHASRLTQLKFVSMTRNGALNIYGPYGTVSKRETFVVSGNMVSIFGRSGRYVEGIGFSIRQ